MKKIIILFSLFCAFNAIAQDAFIIENVRLFNGETVQENMSVLVENGYISEVKKGNIKSDVTRIDGQNKTLIPALTNAHVHAWAPASLKEAASAGVLNVLDMHGMEMAQDMMRTYKDSTNYANYYVSGSAATAPEGHGTQFGFPVATLTKPEEAKQFVEDRVNAKADYIKIILEPWKVTLSIETVTALIKEAHLVDKKAVVHISRLEDAIAVLSNDADGLVHLWWDKQMDSKDLKTLSNDKTFFVTPTLLTTLRFFDSMTEGRENFMTKEQMLLEVKKLYDAGIPILAGTDPPNVGINYGTDLYEEFKLLSEAGIPNIDILKGATSFTAEAFGLEKTGKIIEGFKADMILVDGNPLEDINFIESINTIWKQGVTLN